MKTKTLAVLAIFGLSYPALATTRTPVTFYYRADRPVKTVSLVGNFNAWDATSHPMVYDPQADCWKLVIELPPGKHAYKFALDRTTLVLDPEAKESSQDGFGGQNSQRWVLPRAQSSRIATGEIDPGTINHLQRLPDLNPVSASSLYLRLNARRGDLREAQVVVDGAPHPMSLYARTVGMDSFHALVSPKKPRFTYYFKALDAQGWHRIAPKGLDRDGEWTYDMAQAHPFEIPKWSVGSVFYQIFPERFYNGDPGNDPQPVEAWKAKPTTQNFFGGDLKGVRQKLLHLSRLGVEGLYLNPIFEATSNHKYNTTDYLAIDPHFGNLEEFQNLLNDCHHHGIKVLLDGVFNHTGTAFGAFKDVEARGAASLYRNWYTFYGFPVVQEPKPNYLAWWGYASLPKLNDENPEVRKYLLSVSRYWLAKGIDGWRLDVPNEVKQSFWVDFRKQVKSQNKNAIIIGEIWDDASAWLGGRHFDSVMNYRFREGLLDYLNGKINGQELGYKLAQIRADYPEQVSGVLFNLLGSHDTSRFLTECQGDKQKLKLAVLMQMTYPGMPVIYYGDEIGMEGAGDPDNRRTMAWDQMDTDLYDYYRKLIALRKHSPELKGGDFQEVPSNGGTYAFLRDKTLVVLNGTPNSITLQEAVPMAKGARPVFPQMDSGVLPPYSGCILKR
jgi:glycosidase